MSKESKRSSKTPEKKERSSSPLRNTPNQRKLNTSKKEPNPFRPKKPDLENEDEKRIYDLVIKGNKNVTR